jgi:RNA polymerase sigma factor (sigma-70 family)
MAADDPDLKRFLAGDQRLLESLISHAQRVVRCRFGLPMDDVKDIAAEAVVRAFERIKRYRPGTSLRKWVATFAANIAGEEIRRRRRRQPIPLHADDGIADDSGAVSLSEIIVDDFLSAVTDEERTIVEMTSSGYSASEIGRELGKSAEAVRQQRSRLMRDLRQRWANEMED